MASVYADIGPGGVDDRLVIDLMYMLQSSLQGLCQKLDDDATVAMADYEDNCYTAIFNVQVEDYRGAWVEADDPSHIVFPGGGLPSAALIQWLFDYVNAFETLAEQLDADNIDTSTYEANAYYACILPFMFEDSKGTIIGNDNTSGDFSTTPDTGGPPWNLVKIGPIGKPDDRVLADLFYAIINGWETMLEQLDVDGATTPPTDTDYEALWYTATILMKIENSQGNVIGNDNTRG